MYGWVRIADITAERLPLHLTSAAFGRELNVRGDHYWSREIPSADVLEFVARVLRYRAVQEFASAWQTYAARVYALHLASRSLEQAQALVPNRKIRDWESVALVNGYQQGILACCQQILSGRLTGTVGSNADSLGGFCAGVRQGFQVCLDAFELLAWPPVSD